MLQDIFRAILNLEESYETVLALYFVNYEENNFQENAVMKDEATVSSLAIG